MNRKLTLVVGVYIGICLAGCTYVALDLKDSDVTVEACLFNQK